MSQNETRGTTMRDARMSFGLYVDEARYLNRDTILYKNGHPAAVIVGYNKWLAQQDDVKPVDDSHAGTH